MTDDDLDYFLNAYPVVEVEMKGNWATPKAMYLKAMYLGVGYPGKPRPDGIIEISTDVFRKVLY